MEDVIQGIQPRITLERTRKYWEELPQRNILQRNNENHQNLKLKKVQNSERKGSQDYIKSSYYMTNGRPMEPEREYSDFLRLTRSGKPTQLPSGFTSLRNKQIRDQESPLFPIPGIIQERDRIIGQEKYFFLPEVERIKPYYPEIVGPDERSTRKQQMVVNTSNRIRTPATSIISLTQLEHNCFTPESNSNSDKIWFQMSQLAVKGQGKFDELHRSNLRFPELTTLQEETVKAIQESCAKLRKSSEESNKRLNQVFEEQYHCKREWEFLDQDINKLFNVFQNIKPQPKANVLDNTYHQEDIKPDSFLENKPRSPSQYQYGYRMTSSEKETLKQIPEASGWPKFCGVGEYDHMEHIDYIEGLFIDVPSIPDY
ncbi:hypothetical protein O181_079534 [Austropuccinia psidii MF-1]|uniref:Uncharacterized protein n=1 Tax=Austropuccinia psidii MF-1 TaxID=1389203 RepID=A0A9Q3FIN9_9BASI|nr:hypothetical protein [Austropuccinia psidii MF-1]